MAKSTVLFDLINSMEQSEKRYFKIFVSRFEKGESASAYLELFDLVNNMEDYQEDKLKRRLSNVRFAKNLSSGKNYLYQLLLKSLRNYHANQSLAIRMQELISEILILEQKGLNKQALKRIRKAEKLALELQGNADLLKLSYIKRRLVRQLGPNKSEAVLPNFHRSNYKLLEGIELELKVLDLYDNTLSLLQKGRGQALDLQVAKAAKWLVDHVKPNQLSFRAKLAYHTILAYQDRFNENLTDTKHYYAKMLSLYQEFPKMKVAQAKSYIGLIANYLNHCIIIKDYVAVPPLLSELERASAISKTQEKRVIGLTYYFKLMYFTCIGASQELRRLIPEIEYYLEANSKSITLELQLSFHHDIGFAYFMEGISDKSLIRQWYQKALGKFSYVISDPTFDIRKDIKIMAKVFAALIHIELENTTVVEFFIRSAAHQVKKEDKKFAPEKLIISYLKKYLNSASGEKREILHELLIQLDTGEGPNKMRIADRMKMWLTKYLS